MIEDLKVEIRKIPKGYKLDFLIFLNGEEPSQEFLKELEKNQDMKDLLEEIFREDIFLKEITERLNDDY